MKIRGDFLILATLCLGVVVSAAPNNHFMANQAFCDLLNEVTGNEASATKYVAVMEPFSGSELPTDPEAEPPFFSTEDLAEIRQHCWCQRPAQCDPEVDSQKNPMLPSFLGEDDWVCQESPEKAECPEGTQLEAELDAHKSSSQAHLMCTKPFPCRDVAEIVAQEELNGINLENMENEACSCRRTVECPSGTKPRVTRYTSDGKTKVVECVKEYNNNCATDQQRLGQHANPELRTGMFDVQRVVGHDADGGKVAYCRVHTPCIPLPSCQDLAVDDVSAHMSEKYGPTGFKMTGEWISRQVEKMNNYVAQCGGKVWMRHGDITQPAGSERSCCPNADLPPPPPDSSKKCKEFNRRAKELCNAKYGFNQWLFDFPDEQVQSIPKDDEIIEKCCRPLSIDSASCNARFDHADFTDVQLAGLIKIANLAVDKYVTPKPQLDKARRRNCEMGCLGMFLKATQCYYSAKIFNSENPKQQYPTADERSARKLKAVEFIKTSGCASPEVEQELVEDQEVTANGVSLVSIKTNDENNFGEDVCDDYLYPPTPLPLDSNIEEMLNTIKMKEESKDKFDDLLVHSVNGKFAVNSHQVDCRSKCNFKIKGMRELAKKETVTLGDCSLWCGQLFSEE